MACQLTIPRFDGSAETVSLESGQTLFVLGSNGSGKSGLILRFYRENRARARRISAHRQTWFSSNELSLSPHDRRQTEERFQHWDTGAQARWQDPHGANRANVAIYDLIDAENVRARSIAAAVDAKDLDRAAKLSEVDAPVRKINDLLRLSNIPVDISIQEHERIFATKSDSPPYSVAQLSDGERNALLIAAEVLTVPSKTLIIVDEPERHLHRSIISPLLTLLFRSRPDCSFVVSTHEIMLAIDNPGARALLLYGCRYSGNEVSAWDFTLLPSGLEIDETLKRDVLGARRKIVFVEGTSSSLDKPLYSLLFPEVEVIAKESCRDVERAVCGIRDTRSLHWVEAFGIVDADGRSPTEQETLKEKGIFTLPAFSIESIYYDPEIQQRVAKRHSATVGSDSTALLEGARSAAIQALIPHVQRLSERAVYKRVREALMAQLPTQQDISRGSTISVSLDSQPLVSSAREQLEMSLRDGDLSTITKLYPVRETPALDTIARHLGFQCREQYESSVRKLLLDDAIALAYVRGFFGALAKALAAHSSDLPLAKS